MSPSGASFTGQRLDAGGPYESLEGFSPDPFCVPLSKRVSGPSRPNLGEFWDSVPWVTPVIGSGCLPSIHVAGFSKNRLIASLRERLDRLEVKTDSGMVPLDDITPPGSERFSSIAARFAASMYVSRVRTAPTTLEVEFGDEARQWDISDDDARQVLIAALLTRLCHGLRAMDPVAFSRQPNEDIELDGRLGSIDDPYDLELTVRKPLQMLLEEDLHESDRIGEHLARGITRLNARILDALVRPKGAHVSLNDVRLATETAWYFLVRPLDLYFGWSELIVGLTLSTLEEPTAASGNRRPSIRSVIQGFREAVPTLKQALEAPTVRSWGRSIDPDRSIHASIARTLATQCELNASGAGARTDMSALPIAVAYSTSFDLELEMALWRTGTPYSVALPIYVEYTGPTLPEPELEVFWVVGDVEPSDTASGDPLAELRRLRNLRPFGAAGSIVATRPLVVRLTGCPLYEEDRQGYAAVASTLGLDPGGTDPGQFFGLAVSFDEHFALRQSQTELIWATQDRRHHDSDDRTLPLSARGLHLLSLKDGSFRPIGNAGSPPGQQVRYWILLGVPTEDPVVRRRVVSLFNLRALASMPDRTSARPGRKPMSDDVSAPTQSANQFASKRQQRAEAQADPQDAELAANTAARLSLVGLAANVSVDDDEANLLSWLGLSVIRTSVAGLVPAIDHYATHLREQTQFSHNGCRHRGGGS